MSEKIPVAKVFGDTPPTPEPVMPATEPTEPDETAEVVTFKSDDGNDYQYNVKKDEKDGKVHFTPVKPFTSKEKELEVSTELYNTWVKAQDERRVQKETAKQNESLQSEIKSLKDEVELLKKPKPETAQPVKPETQLEKPDYLKDLMNFAGVANEDEFESLTVFQQEQARAKALNKQAVYNEQLAQQNLANMLATNQAKSKIQSIVENAGKTMDDYLAWCRVKGVDSSNINVVEFFLGSNKPATTVNKPQDDTVDVINKVISLSSQARPDLGGNSETNIIINSNVDTEKQENEKFVKNLVGAAGVKRPPNRY